MSAAAAEGLSHLDPAAEEPQQEESAPRASRSPTTPAAKPGAKASPPGQGAPKSAGDAKAAATPASKPVPKSAAASAAAQPDAKDAGGPPVEAKTDATPKPAEAKQRSASPPRSSQKPGTPRQAKASAAPSAAEPVPPPAAGKAAPAAPKTPKAAARGALPKSAGGACTGGSARRKAGGGASDDAGSQEGSSADGQQPAPVPPPAVPAAPEPPAKIPLPPRQRRRPGAKAIAFVIGLADASSDVTGHTHNFPVPDCYKLCMRKFSNGGVCASYGPWCDCKPSERRLRLFGDAATALRLQHERPDLDIHILYPRKVRTARLRSFDMTFLLGYDAVSAQLDASNGDTSMVSRAQAKAFIDAVQAPGAKVCPSPTLQAFGCCKRTYYQRAMDNDIPIAPTRFARTPEERTPQALLAIAKSQQWINFVVKPAVGSWNDGVEFFNLLPEESETPEQAEERVLRELKEHSTLASIKRSADLVIQKCMPGFTTNPEVRVFWAHGRFLYAVSNWRSKVRSGIQRCKVPERFLQGAKQVGQMVIDRMLPETPLGLIRTDIGCNTEPDGSFWFFMNEVDTCPGWYADRYLDSVATMVSVFSESADKVGEHQAEAETADELSDKEDDPVPPERRPSRVKAARRVRPKWEKKGRDDADSDSGDGGDGAAAAAPAAAASAAAAAAPKPQRPKPDAAAGPAKKQRVGPAEGASEPAGGAAATAKPSGAAAAKRPAEACTGGGSSPEYQGSRGASPKRRRAAAGEKPGSGKKDGKDPKDGKETKEAAKPAKDAKEAKEPKALKEAAQQGKPAKDRDTKEAKDTKEPKDGKENGRKEKEAKAAAAAGPKDPKGGKEKGKGKDEKRDKQGEQQEPLHCDLHVFAF